VIAEYASSLAARLAFDPALARRVREEVEEHLREAAAAIQAKAPSAARSSASAMREPSRRSSPPSPSRAS